MSSRAFNVLACFQANAERDRRPADMAKFRCQGMRGREPFPITAAYIPIRRSNAVMSS